MGKPLSLKVIESRKRNAEVVVQRKAQDGYKFKNAKDVRRVLREDCDDLGIEKDFYNCLTGDVLADLLVNIINQGVYPNEPPPLQNPVPVPIEKPIISKRTATDSHHRSDSGIASSVQSSHSDKGCEDQSNPGTQDDEFYVIIKLPHSAEPELLKACRCSEKCSYISNHIFAPSSRPPLGQQMRLSWWEVGSEHKSRRRTVFKVARREEVLCDLAFGRDWSREDQNANGELSPGVQTTTLTPVETAVSATSKSSSNSPFDAAKFVADVSFHYAKNVVSAQSPWPPNDRRMSSGSEGRQSSRSSGYG